MERGTRRFAIAWALAVVLSTGAVVAVAQSDGESWRHLAVGEAFTGTPDTAACMRQPDLIYAPLKAGESLTRVMVVLREPEANAGKVDWDNAGAAAARRDAVWRAQSVVLGRLGRAEHRIRRLYDNIPAFSVELSAEALAALLADDNVASIEPVQQREPFLRQGIPMINASAVRGTYNGQGVAIAIIDAAFDYTHPQLGGGGFPNSKIIGGYDFADEDSDPFPNGSNSVLSHGTPVAGIAAGALADIDDYIGGVAYNAKIYALKVAQTADGAQWDDDILAALDWCITHKNDSPTHPILVANMSLGAGQFFSACDGASASWSTMVANLINAGIKDIVVPLLARMILELAGVDFSPEYPGGDPSTVQNLDMVIEIVVG
ncbi:MAG TPA: S8 family serine peptidase, partial [Candidatus Hydrogenedentes bacterium]|nr:S8 family serine peptidase [Candidatus Hydrogenedentota bacterium]